MLSHLLLGLLGVAGYSGDSLAEQVARVVRDVRDAEAAGPAATMLAKLGAGAMPELLDLLESGTVPAAGIDAGTIVLGAPAREAMVRAFALLPVERARTLLGSAAGVEAPATRRRAVLEAFAGFARVEDLAVILRTAQPQGSTPVDSRTGLALESAVLGALRRDPGTYPRLEKEIPRASGDLRIHLVRCLGNAACDEAMRTLAGLFGLDPQLDILLVSAIGQTARGLTPEALEEAAFEMEWYIHSSDPALQRVAVLCAGKLRDSRFVPALVTMLQNGDPVLRQSAHWSVRQITGLSFGPAPDRWRAWFEREQRWWAEDHPDLREMLASTDSEKVADAVSQMASKCLEREVLSTDLLPLLDHHDPGLRFLACSALGQLRQRTAISRLTEALHDPDPDVAAGARLALDRIAEEAPPR